VTSTNPPSSAATSTPPSPTIPHGELYTDGACSGNPGPGGWAFILRDRKTQKELEGTEGEAATTNNRMELQAVIEGLGVLNRPALVELYSDSKYVLNGLKEWMDGWKKRGWKTASKQPVKNRDLWERLDELRGIHELRFHWVKGHSDHPENERADRLAVKSRDRYLAEASGKARG